MRLSDFSIDRPVTITMLVLIILVIGGMSMAQLGLDLMPDIDFPTLSIMTRYEGAASEDIERLVSRPLEAAVAAVNGVSGIQSISQEDSSILLIEFTWGTDLDEAAQDLRQAVGLVEQMLPEAAEDPMVVKFSLDAFPVLGYGVSSNQDLITLSEFLGDEIVPRLERIDGVAQVVVMGGQTEEVQVEIDRAALEAAGLGMTQVTQMLFAQNLDLPAGRIVEDGEEYLLRTRGAFTDLRQIADIPVGMSPTGAPIRLDDVADVRMGVEDVRNISRTNEASSLFMMINKQSGSNPLQVAQRLKSEINQIREENPEMAFALVMDTGQQIEQMASGVSQTGVLGGLLAIIFMFMFLRSARPTLAIAVAIPLSLLTTFIPIYVAGETLNLMTMGGLMLGIGMLVDNAVVVIENIFRHLEMGKDRKEAARDGSREVGMAITASTMTTLVVFLPLFFGGGLAGQLVRGLALVVAFALGASLLVALTIVPMLASVLFNRKTAELGSREGGLFTRFKEAYGRVLSWALDHRKTTLAGVMMLVIGSLALVPLVGADFMPASDQPLIMGKVRFPIGTPIGTTDRAVARLEEIATQIPGVMTVGVNIGVNEDDLGAGLSDMNPAGVHEAQVFLRLEEERPISQAQVIELLRTNTPDIQDMSVEFMDMGQAMMGGGGQKPVQIKIFGAEFEVLEELADEAIAAIENIEGLVDITSSIQDAKPERHLMIDRERATSYGLSAAEIARAVEAASLGQVAGLYRDSGKEYFIRVRYEEGDRQRVADLDRILVPTQLGMNVPLSHVARFVPGSGPVQIRRENQGRRITVDAGIEGADLATVMTQVDAALDPMRRVMPIGYQIEFGGTFEQMVEAFTVLLAALALSILLVYMVMASQFEAFIHPLVIMATLPLALIGVIPAMLVLGKTISVVTFVGMIVLAGVVVNNGIVLIDYVNQLRREGHDRRTALVKGGVTRLRAVLITSGTTIAGLLPMGLFPAKGAELTADLAVAVAGGLAASTLLTLVVVPVVYEIFDTWGEKGARFVRRFVHPDEGKSEDRAAGPPVGPGGDDPVGVAARVGA